MRQLPIATFLVLAFSLFFAHATHADERIPITHLIMRDRTITIATAPNGLVYSVSTKDGTVIDANLSEAQLQAKYPEVYEKVRPAIANSEESNTVIPWAGI
jgi:hypothetical protein